MVDQGKEAGRRARYPHPGVASRRTSDANDSAGAEPQKPTASPPSRTGLSDQTRNRIAAQLRTMYDTITQQPVPDRFADLIAKLDSADRK
ncbi:anti-sigma factor [Methylobacterium sp. J-070]|nr:anti-sigma factor [Methylobacterium sp. J-070]